MIFLQKSLDFFILFFVHKMKKDQIYGKNETRSQNVSGWANTSCRFDFSQERSLCLSYVYVQW